ncbi:MAG: translational GTPase TypA [Leptospiraceae bacterium]|nr:translational GTPase TypA [Leptospiraceae bacterium]MDW8305956.1 translational GTPase TypA [Leptospiraceae bacterium]
MVKSIRNIAIIAHVDHGKTTLVDQILRFCQGAEIKKDTERILDFNELERERGITILAKNTAVEYKGIKINIVDTPGHSDFGGEVERVLRMVDSSLLLIDAMEGPMPQTRFVLKKSLELGHKVILVVNKIDKPNVEINKVVDKTFELFLELGASDEQIDFPVVYTSAKLGYALRHLSDEKKDISPLLETILEYAPEVKCNEEANFQFQVTTLDYNDYLGRICIGRIYQGKIRVNDPVVLIGINEKHETIVSRHRVTKLFTFLGLRRLEVNEASCGDIVAVAGIPEMTIGDTLCGEKEIAPLPRIEIEPPTVSVYFMVNDSPFAGKEGKWITSRNLRERLEKEARVNIALKIEEVGEVFKVSGRGELQLAILMENMRREGYEFGVSKPEVIFKEENGIRLEPFEELTMDLPEEYSGPIIQELNRRKGLLTQMENLSAKRVRIRYEIPTRGLIGFRSFFLTETRGEGTLASLFLDYRPYAGDFSGRKRGALVSMENGVANTYALFHLQERGDLFIEPQTPVYVGMIIGLHSKENDLDVNPIREKKLTNVRASGSEEAMRLIPVKKMSLEECLDLLEEDEVLEVTPLSLRLRKKVLNPSLRKRK